MTERTTDILDLIKESHETYFNASGQFPSELRIAESVWNDILGHDDDTLAQALSPGPNYYGVEVVRVYGAPVIVSNRYIPWDEYWRERHDAK